MSAFTVRLADETTDKLDRLAAKLDRSRSYVAARAIEDFVARESWQLAEIEAGLADANRGDFATDAEVETVLAKYLRS
ncbi:CopG family ribbon-helix-helix protein [Labrys neptuniae]